MPPQGVVNGGQFFPDGTVIGMNPWIINRNQSIFGENADVWRPERWLDDDKTLLSKDGEYPSFGKVRSNTM